MKNFFVVTILLIMVASCSRRGANLSDKENEDSLRLRVAVVPTMDCLPVYYAKHMGIFDSLQIDVQLMHYISQMDLDTALASGQAELGHSCIPRLEVMQRKGVDSLLVMAEIPEQLFLITARTKRIKTLRQLKGKMVGLERFSNSDWWSDRIMEMSGMEQTDIYRPQFNDAMLRTSMVVNQLVDAALVPEPYATVALLKGNKLIFCTPDSVAGFNCFAMPKRVAQDSLKTVQNALFMKAYERAVKELNKEPDQDSLRVIFKTYYGLTDEVIDSLELPKLRHLKKPMDDNRKAAAQWVADRLNI